MSERFLHSALEGECILQPFLQRQDIVRCVFLFYYFSSSVIVILALWRLSIISF